MLFDEPYYIAINQARWAVAENVLNQLRIYQGLSFTNCIDVGCGPGWFSEKLVNWGVNVIGLEGRQELVEEASKRVTEAKFYQVDVESTPQMSQFAGADLVFCFGLLYHTENPFKVIRNLNLLTKKVLFIESMNVPLSEPVTYLVEEGKNETQGLTYHAMIPSRSCLLKMLQVSGFPYLYDYQGYVDHEDFWETETKHQRRGIFLASTVELQVSDLVPSPEIVTPKYNFFKQ